MNADIAREHVRAFKAEPVRMAAASELQDINDSIARYAKRGESRLCYDVESLSYDVQLRIEMLLEDAGYQVKMGYGRESGQYLEISWE